MPRQRKPTPPAAQQPLRFEGFAVPHYTQVPDELFDTLMPHLSGAELKVLLYIIRRTFGFKKPCDAISLSQMVSGIRTREGAVLDEGTGLGKSSVARALNSLEKKQIIVRVRSQGQSGGDAATSYALKMRDPVSQNETPPGAKMGHGVSHQRDTQQTAEQETDTQQAALAAALVELGIDTPTAERLIQRHDARLLAQKLDYVAYLQTAQPQRVKNPRGWLLKAIEQDYGPPAGYQPRSERELQQARQAKRRAAGREARARLQRAQRSALRSRRRHIAQLLAAAQETYQTTPAELRLWEEILSQLRGRVSDSIFALIKEARLLTINDGTAVIGTASALSARWLGDHLRTELPALFARGGQPVERIQVMHLTAEQALEADDDSMDTP